MPAPSLLVRSLTVDVGGRRVVDGVDLEVPAGHRTALLGRSGSGKSLTAAAVLGRLPAGARAGGSVLVAGHEVLGVPAARRPAQARTAAVLQDSATALHPLVRVGDQLALPLLSGRRPGWTGGRRGWWTTAAARREALGVALELLTATGLDDVEEVLRRYPGELSGGQRQRVCTALALLCDGPLLVADEPTTALDVVTQQRVVALLRERTGAGASGRGPALLFVTHDVAVAATLCESAAVLDAGRVVEHGPIADVLARPRHRAAAELVGAAREQDLLLARVLA